MNFVANLYKKYRAFQPFTPAEAWELFRLAAIGEAIGWTLLISGILLSKLPVSWNQIPVQLAGRTHGVLFLIYATAVVVLSPSLSWSWKRIFVGTAASVPPYGSLLFELWASHRKHHEEFSYLHGFLHYKLATTVMTDSL
jgi:integral membrane protein